MKSIERMQRVLTRQAADRRPFVPSVYEHGAAVIGRAPGETSRSAEMMAAAAVESWRRYQHDIVSVGIDIYNIEAEAFGCEVSAGADGSIPGVTSHPLAGAESPGAADLPIPRPDGTNRLGLIAEASRRVVEEIGSDVWVYACMGGPFSQAVELRGFEDFIADICLVPESAHGLLARTTELSLQQARLLCAQGCGVYLFESWATIPLIDPRIFGQFVVPYNKRVIDAVRAEFDVPPPAVVMGGDTAILMDFFIEVGTSLVVADFNTDFAFMRDKIADRDMIIRGCADPKVIERGDWEALARSVEALARKSAGMRNFVWGCGCVPLDTPAEHLLRFKQMCLAAGQ